MGVGAYVGGKVHAGFAVNNHHQVMYYVSNLIDPTYSS